MSEALKEARKQKALEICRIFTSEGYSGPKRFRAYLERVEAALSESRPAESPSESVPAPEGGGELDEGELLPCPFCGSAAAMQESEDDANFIECTNKMCAASTNLQYSLMDDGRPQLVERWNRRAKLLTSVQRLLERANPAIDSQQWPKLKCEIEDFLERQREGEDGK